MVNSISKWKILSFLHLEIHQIFQTDLAYLSYLVHALESCI